MYSSLGRPCLPGICAAGVCFLMTMLGNGQKFELWGLMESPWLLGDGRLHLKSLMGALVDPSFLINNCWETQRWPVHLTLWFPARCDPSVLRLFLPPPSAVTWHSWGFSSEPNQCPCWAAEPPQVRTTCIHFVKWDYPWAFTVMKEIRCFWTVSHCVAQDDLEPTSEPPQCGRYRTESWPKHQLSQHWYPIISSQKGETHKNKTKWSCLRI